MSINKRTKVLFSFSLVITVAISVALGFAWGEHSYKNQNSQKLESIDFKIFWDAYSKLKNVYNGSIDPQKYLYGAIAGGYSSLNDPYTVFLPPEISKQFQDELSGNLEGVGMKLGFKDNLPTVIAPIEGSPAFKAGIRAGDKILKVDEFVTDNQLLDLVVSKIRGAAGTKVKLTVQKSADSAIKELELTREKINVTTIEESFVNDAVVITVSEFGTQTMADFDAAVIRAKEKNINKVVLDLRNNPGGLLDSAIEMEEYFLQKGSIAVVEESRNGKIEHKTKSERGWQNVKLVVLVNDGSASASEIFAGAMKDLKRAKVIGTKTFGKGTVQELSDLGGGSSVKITVAKWLTPSGTNIDKDGIEPDTKVEDNPNSIFDNNDPVLKEALKQLNN